jgi:Cohesin domain
LRKKRILGLLVVAGAGVAAASLLLPDRPQPDSAQPAKTEARSPSSDGRFAALPSRDAIGKPRGELFGSRSWAPSPPVARAAPVAAPAAAPPPMPYRIAGQVVHDGTARVVLARDDRVLTVREGEMLDDNYRVESIKADGVTLVYLPLGVREQLPVSSAMTLDTPTVATAGAAPVPARTPEQSSAAGASRPAQLRWEGPERVQAGNNFNVALKLTSDQPVRASPLQLSFDAKLLEAVAVRPGGFFSDGSFTYRVNPGGSIFVGASGMGGVAADAEFLIVTFRPIRSGAAELKLSSLVLQGAAGRAIAHEPPAAFRTAIMQ